MNAKTAATNKLEPIPKTRFCGWFRRLPIHEDQRHANRENQQKVRILIVAEGQGEGRHERTPPDRQRDYGENRKNEDRRRLEDRLSVRGTQYNFLAIICSARNLSLRAAPAEELKTANSLLHLRRSNDYLTMAGSRQGGGGLAMGWAGLRSLMGAVAKRVASLLFPLALIAFTR